MGNGNVTGNKDDDKHKSTHSKAKQSGETFFHKKFGDSLVFYTCTDKAPVITEILQERGWTRTRDQNATNFLIKWCLEHQVDWSKFQEGKQLINNIPGQITFADKVNLWYTIRDYVNSRRSEIGNYVQMFLPMTFVLDNDDEVNEFLRVYKKQNRTWICKPRYRYAGQGIHVITANSDLETILKVKNLAGNRTQLQPKTPGHLMQEYISRPLLIKGRKFDIRVHWLVAWTKPLLVFYNHLASVIRLSLNLYREFDFDRATHLTNLSIQEHHYRYAYSQEATGMTMLQLNNYFNDCFRPFHPKMPQDWVLTVMQDRMHTIIRQVIRASKSKLGRAAGYFGLFGCDFLLDENFRLWLLEVNDNPGVGWGNTQVNLTTKPLFTETLDIVLECLEKHNQNRPLLPIECLKNYQLIYDENNDGTNMLYDDKQVFSERMPVMRPVIRVPSARSSANRALPAIKINRTPAATPTLSNDIAVPLVAVNNINNQSSTKEKVETLKPIENNNIDYDRLAKMKDVREKYTFRLRTQSLDKLNNINVHRSFSSENGFSTIQRKRYLNLKPNASDKAAIKKRNIVIPATLTEDKQEDAMVIEVDELKSSERSVASSTDSEKLINGSSSTTCAVH